MAKAKRRVRRNVQMGFYDATGFHPIRASRDYDSGLFDEEGSYRKKKRAKGKKKTGRRKKNASTSRGLPADPAWMKRSDLVAVRRGGKVILQKRNPLPVGRKVKVRVVRRRNGTIDIYSA